MSATEHPSRDLRHRAAIPDDAGADVPFFSDRDLKDRWNACHPDWTVIAEAFDFRVGGIEAKRWRTADGDEQTFTAHYLDIVAPDRIVYAFEMSFGGERVSASLATVALRPEDGQTRMKYTEQIAFFGSRAALDRRDCRHRRRLPEADGADRVGDAAEA